MLCLVGSGVLQQATEFAATARASLQVLRFQQYSVVRVIRCSPNSRSERNEEACASTVRRAVCVSGREVAEAQSRPA